MVWFGIYTRVYLTMWKIITGISMAMMQGKSSWHCCHQGENLVWLPLDTAALSLRTTFDNYHSEAPSYCHALFGLMSALAPLRAPLLRIAALWPGSIGPVDLIRWAPWPTPSLLLEWSASSADHLTPRFLGVSVYATLVAGRRSGRV